MIFDQKVEIPLIFIISQFCVLYKIELDVHTYKICGSLLILN